MWRPLLLGTGDLEESVGLDVRGLASATIALLA